MGLCIVTGDIAEAARPKEYKEALAFFEALGRKMDLERTRFVFTPGNHDVSWAITKKLVIDMENGEFEPDELMQHIQASKLDAFEDLLSAFYDKERSQMRNVQSLGYGSGSTPSARSDSPWQP